MRPKWDFTILIMIALLGGIITSWPSAQVAGHKDAVRAVKKPRRARRLRPPFVNFMGAEPVTEIPLSNYDWVEVENIMNGLLEAALGPEVAYWKNQGVTCDDIVHTVRELHNIFLHSVRVVLIRNQTWHFLDPIGQAAGGGGSGNGLGQRGTRPGQQSSRFDWPLLVPNPPDTCSSPCQAQLKYIHQAIAARLEGWRSKAPPAKLLPPRYRLPDMVFVINAADNMQRFGAGSRAPVLSLMKWWQVTWTASQQQQQQGPRVSNLGEGASERGDRDQRMEDSRQLSNGSNSGGDDGTGSPAVSLGRIGGKLLQPLDLPSHVAQLRAAAASGVAGVHGGISARTETVKGPAATAASAVTAMTAAAAAATAAAAPMGVEDADPLWDMVRKFVSEKSLGLPPVVQLESQQRQRPTTDPRRRQYDMDLLLPTMAFAPQSLSYFSWELKKDIAFFSGIAFCPLYKDLHPICPRALLANVSAAGWFPSDLEVRLVRRFRGRLGSKGQYRRTVKLKGTSPTAPRDHSRYRYLLHMDGLAGSTRMGVLMATDSVILKSRSPFIEYYSRLQVPGAHYLEFWKDPNDPLDVLKVLREARASTTVNREGARAAAEANQAIAARYLAMEPKLIYARAALLAYNSLVPDMESCVRDLLQHLERSGHPLPGR